MGFRKFKNSNSELLRALRIIEESGHYRRTISKWQPWIGAKEDQVKAFKEYLKGLFNIDRLNLQGHVEKVLELEHFFYPIIIGGVMTVFASVVFACEFWRGRILSV